MQSGKLPEAALKRSVLRQLCPDPAQLQLRLGEDCAALQKRCTEDSLTLFSVVNEVPGFADDPGKLVIAAANNLEACGAAPAAFLVSAVIPEDCEEARLREDMRRIEETAFCAVAGDGTAEDTDRSGGTAKLCGTGEPASQHGTGKTAAPGAVIGGHTQISSSVLRPLYTITGIGDAACTECRKDILLRPGDDLVVTGRIALAGTAALAIAHGEELGKRYPFSLIDRAKAFERQMAVGATARAITHFGTAAVHDLSQGGIFNALWEMAERAGAGLEVDLRKIPVYQETIEICEYFDINPYYLYSAGALLVGTEHGEALVSFLAACGIEAAVIGRVTGGNDRLIRNGGECRYLDRPKPDEWYRAQKTRGKQAQ